MTEFEHLLQTQRLLPRDSVMIGGRFWIVMISLDLRDGWYFHILRQPD